MKKNNDFVQKKMRLSTGEILYGISLMYAMINFGFMIIVLLSKNTFIIEMLYWGSFILPIVTLIITLIVNKYSKFIHKKTKLGKAIIELGDYDSIVKEINDQANNPIYTYGNALVVERYILIFKGKNTEIIPIEGISCVDIIPDRNYPDEIIKIIFEYNESIHSFNVYTKADAKKIEEHISKSIKYKIDTKKKINYRDYSVEILDKQLDISNVLNLLDARLIKVDGKGAFRKTVSYDNKDNYYSEILLNDQVLVQETGDMCPTCASTLGTGFGIDKEIEELKEISNKVNQNYTTLDDAIERITPLLSLLKSGFYVVADALCFPTDGYDFFWNTNNIGKNSCTAGYCGYAEGTPTYLFPSENTDNLNQDRIKHYREIIKKNYKNYPRAVAYNLEHSINIILDGHHKATSAFLEGCEVPTLLIIPASGYQIPGKVYFNDINLKNDFGFKYKDFIFDNVKGKSKDISPGNIIKNKFAKEFSRNEYLFPNINEYVPISYYKNCKNEELEELLDKYDNEYKIASILAKNYFKGNNLSLKEIEKCFKSEGNLVKFWAFKLLKKMYLNNKQEIDKIFVDYLIYCEDSKDYGKELIDKFYSESTEESSI